MTLEEFRLYCLSKPSSVEDMPFDETTLVFRVNKKIFALTDIEKIPFSVNLKCEPTYALELRERYECISPGYHMNKKHWITVIPDISISDDLIKELIDGSYNAVIGKKSKKN
jgi:predicted DNA-binding protein (MmcQ/YjbR family)